MYLKRKMNGFVPGDRSLPSLPSLPIIGSLLSLVTDRSPHIFQDCPCFFQQLQKKYGDLYSLMMGSHKVLIVNNHHHAKEVLFKKGKIFAGRPRTVIKLLHFHHQLNFTKISYLVHNPPVNKRKIQQELDNKIGKDRHPQLSNRGNLPYLEATIREVLRIRPVSPLLIPHVVLKDTSVGEYTVQKGTRKEWKNPELFDPGRFLNEEGDGLCCPSASYLPFGAGVRVCLGEALAKMKLFLFLSWILQRFTLEMPAGQPLPDLQGKFGVVLQHKKF
uniref:Cytochrome P450 family 17 subfamily A member 1 n=1 Tax=Sinocyclocheilus rhinocerous TaxID=307959 RepID=A0A673NRF5_9TELE